MNRPGSKGSIMQQIKKEEIKQAVVVDVEEASLCHKRILAGKPLLAYSLDWLRLEKFDEVFICCRPGNAQEIRKYIEKYKLYQSGSHLINIQVRPSEKNDSVGDCLRDLDSKALIKADFVVMKVGCCGNIPLTKLLEEHKRLRTQDKNAIITTITRSIPPKQMIIQNNMNKFIYVCDSKNGRLLRYIKNDAHANKNVEIPTNLLLQYDSLRVYSNLVDTDISIYAPNVPILFSEEFDYKTQPDLFTGIFANEEILGYTIYVHLLDDLYNQSVSSPLGCMSQDLKCFDEDFVYKRRESYNILRQVSSDSLVQCTKLSESNYLDKYSGKFETDVLILESDSDDDDLDQPDDDEVIFQTEVLDSYTRAFVEHIENKNLILEINSSKHAYNISIKDLHPIIIRALLDLPSCLNEKTPNNATEYFAIEKAAIRKFQSVFLNYIQTADARASVLTSIEDVLLSKTSKHLNESVFANLIYEFYDIDVLDEESILQWVNVYDKSDSRKKDLRDHSRIKALVQFLEQDSENDKDDDTDESE